MTDNPPSTEQSPSQPPMKVATNSSVTAVAGAIAGKIREGHTVEMHAIGVGAIYQAVKAIATAQLFLQEDDIAIATMMSFIDLIIDDKERTGIQFQVWRKQPG